MLPNLCWATTKITISIAAPQKAISLYKALPESARKTPLSPGNIPKEINTRCVAGIVIIKNALKLGGLDAEIKFLQVPNARRESDEVAKSNAVIGSHLLNARTLDIPGYKARMFLTTAVAQTGEFQKGIYCLPDNNKILSVTNLKELKKAGKALIGLHWDNDYRVLTDMGITGIERGPTVESMFKMLKAGRADWIPLGFQNPPDMSINHKGVRLVPVPGIKIAMVESRHFVLSRRHPQGQMVYDAMEKGMKVMREQGLMKQILSQTGVTCPAVKDWKIINKDQIAYYR